MMAKNKMMGTVVGVGVGVVVALLMASCLTQQAEAQDLNAPSMFVDDVGHLRIQTANKSVYINELDLVSVISQQQQQLDTQAAIIDQQQSINAAIESTLAEQQLALIEQQYINEELNNTIADLRCREFNTLPFDASTYNYSVSVLGQGVRVDYTSDYLNVGGSGTSKWQSGILASNGLVYGAPYGVNSVLVIDPTNEMNVTGFPVELTVTSPWYGVVEAANGKLYFLPNFADHVLIVDPNNNNAVDQTSIVMLGTDSAKWYKGALAPNNGKIYCVPGSSQSVLIIDPSDDTADTTTISGLPNDSFKWVGGVLANNGLIYGIPRNYDFVLIINPMTDTADYTSVAVESGGNKWLDGVLANNGKIYGIPGAMPKVLVIDTTNNNAVSYIDITLPTATANWVGGVLTGKGKIISFSFNADIVLVIDTETDTTDATSLQVPSSTNKWNGGVSVPNHNRIYGMPFDQDHILQIDFDPCM